MLFAISDFCISGSEGKENPCFYNLKGWDCFIMKTNCLITYNSRKRDFKNCCLIKIACTNSDPVRKLSS